MKLFPVLHYIFIFVSHVIVAEELLLVGPPELVWKVLRETDGERFVALRKDAVFKENLQTEKMKFAGTRTV
jgi:hypothetical protein